MKRIQVKPLVAALVVLLAASSCAQAESGGNYRLTILRNDKALLTCRFSGEDKNGDGTLETAELTALQETEDYAVSETSSHTGFAAYADVGKMPVIEHGPEDIRTFRFDLKAFKNGKNALEYKTDTKRDFTFGKYHFWRIVEVKADGKIGFFHGVGDGTRGLSLSMLDAAALTFKIAAE